MATHTPEYAEQQMKLVVEKARVAQVYFEENYTDQRSVDEVVRAIGMAVYYNSDELAQMAVDETQMGTFEGKKGKAMACLKLWNYMKGRPSLGVVDDFSEPGIKILLKPSGVVGAVMPSTNPIATAVCNSMMALKGRNAIIIAAHPGAAKTSARTVELMREALVKIGAPADLVQGIEEPSLEMTTAMLHQCDVNIATGGAAMVKSVYSAGKPAYGVGQGNCQDIVDEDYPDFNQIAAAVVKCRSMDRGVPCVGDQMMHIPASREQEMVDAMVANGAFLINDKETIDRIRSIIFPTEAINRAVVGKSPQELGKMFGIDVPESARVLFIKVNGCGYEDDLCKEILCPIVRYYTYDKFEDGVARAVANLRREGAGHNSSVWSMNPERQEYAALRVPVSRFHVNQPTAGGGNGLCPTISLGCGTWGGNSISDHLQYFHLLNQTRMTTVVPQRGMVDADWDDYNFRDDWGTKVKY